MRQHVGWLALFLLTSVGSAADKTVERYVEFRDGSVLKLPVVDETFKLSVLRTDGKIETQEVLFSELQSLSLAADRVFEKKRQVLQLVEKLGSDDFAQRDHAQERLLELGPTIRRDLEIVQSLFTDPEIKSRLRTILGGWKDDDKTARAGMPFDAVQLKEQVWGDIGDTGIPVVVEGKVRRLARKDVAGLSVQPPDVALDLPRLGGVRRLQANEFPRGCIEEGFETAPDGRRLKVGENIEKLFIKKGFTLATSIKSSHVSVNDFVVNGKSRALSAATHQPLFQGEITITFCKPGQENVPAGVHYVGLWVAYVEINGTSIQAFDLQGRELGKMPTQKREHDFLGIYSPVPIHKLKIVPNLQIDPDYTFDDLTYSPPQTADMAHPERFGVQLASGERVLCKDVTFGMGGVEMHGLPAELPDRTVNWADVVRVTAPEKKANQTAGIFVELLDGSVVFGAKPQTGATPKFAHKPDALKNAEEVVGLWGTGQLRPLWPGASTSAQLAVFSPDKAMTWQTIADVKLLADAVKWQEGAKEQSKGYFELAPLLLRQPKASGGPGLWHVRTARGEDLVLGGEAKVTGKGSQGLTFTWDGHEVKLATEELVSVFRAPK